MAITKIGTTGISNNLDVPGYLYLSGDNKELRFYNGANYMILKASGSLSNNYTITLPVDDGTTGQFLKTDGGGVTSWDTVTSSDTTYTTAWVDSSANAILRLTAGGSGSGTDDLTIVAGSNITLTPSGDNLTIAAASGGSNSFTNDVTITSGNLVMATAGKGIDFSATSDEIGAGSMSSEILNDYEEGTFTAILKDSSGNSATQSANAGRYTKIGNQVFVHIQIRLTSISGMVSGNTARIDGMPFAASSEAELVGGTFCWYASTLNMTNGGKYISANPEPSDTYMHMREWGENQEGVSTGLTVGEISADGHILMSGIIRT